MKNKILLAALLAAAFGLRAWAQDQVTDLEFYKQHVKTLAADDFGGRKPLTPYETKTINYIADVYKQLGLQPCAEDGSYFQPVKEVATYTRPAGNKITVRGPKGKLDLRFYDDVVVWTNRATDKVVIPTTNYVFVGFGANAPEYGWNDFDGIDVRGKIILCMVNDPGFYDQSLFRGRNMTYYGRWTYKFEEAQRQGAAGCLVIHNTAAASYGFEVCQSSHSQTEISLCGDDNNASALGMDGWITEDATRKLFATSGLDYDELAEQAKKPGFKAVELKSKSSITLNVKSSVGTSHNVVGLLPGTDLKDEYVVCTAHWDHFGIGVPIDGDSIYNGASDNASGVACMLMYAKKFKELPMKPRRSMVFVAVTSEEAGLLGSQWYCEHPLFPLSKTAANVNLDGTGAPAMRSKNVVLRNAGKSNIDEYALVAASAQGRRLDVQTEDPGGGYFRADHFNFVKVGVPAVLVSAGRDYYDQAKYDAKPKVSRYHQPNDEYDESWWDFDGAIENMDLVFSIALQIANADQMPQWTKESDFQRQPDK